MFDQLSANVLLGFLPAMSVSLPGIGAVDVQKILAALLLFCILTAIFWFIRIVVLLRLQALARKTTATFDDVFVDSVQNIRAWVYVVVSLYASMQFFALPELANQSLNALFYFSIMWQGIEVALCFVDYFATQMLERDKARDAEPDPNVKTVAHMVKLIARIGLWGFGIIFVLSNLGIEVASLIAGMGIGGIAIAFALQGVLGDLFASFSLYLDKPFRIGDFIVIGADSGTVEKIGIKSTRIRTLQGEELVVANTELTTARVQNFKKMQKRRIVTQFGITYETAQEKVKETPAVITRIFEALEGAHLDRVHFTTFGDSALIFEIVYFVESSKYADYLDIQQSFNLDLMTRFAEMEVEFAYPTQTIYNKTVS